MRHAATSVAGYLAGLPEDRRQTLTAVRDVILANLGEGFEEGLQYGMVGYFVPHRLYPNGYHVNPKQPLPFAMLGSQKNHCAVYLMSVYGSKELEAWFRAAWAKTGKKLDLGKACLRFKTVDDLALDVLGETIARTPVEVYVRRYEQALASPRPERRPSAKRPAAPKGRGSVKRPATAKRPLPAKRARPARRSG